MPTKNRTPQPTTGPSISSRYRTIAVFGTFYFVGTGLMAAAAYPGHEDKDLFMFAFFGLVALGAGGIKSNGEGVSKLRSLVLETSRQAAGTSGLLQFYVHPSPPSTAPPLSLFSTQSQVVTMGGDQFNLEHPEESAQKDTYFIYFYWVINVGALFSYFVMAQVGELVGDLHKEYAKGLPIFPGRGRLCLSLMTGRHWAGARHMPQRAPTV
jgi:dipeptide/tripeptide permease